MHVHTVREQKCCVFVSCGHMCVCAACADSIKVRSLDVLFLEKKNKQRDHHDVDDTHTHKHTHTHTHTRTRTRTRSHTHTRTRTRTCTSTTTRTRTRIPTPTYIQCTLMRRGVRAGWGQRMPGVPCGEPQHPQGLLLSIARRLISRCAREVDILHAYSTPLLWIWWTSTIRWRSQKEEEEIYLQSTGD